MLLKVIAMLSTRWTIKYRCVCRGVLIIFRILQEPVRVTLGEKRVWKGRGQKRQCVEVCDTFMYIPLLKTIQVLLQNSSVVAQVCMLKTVCMHVCRLSAEYNLCDQIPVD